MKKQLTAVEVRDGWRKTTVGLIFGTILLFLAGSFLVVVLCGGEKVIGIFGAITYGIVALCLFLYGIYGLIRYGKTGRLINRWGKITSEPTNNFPMSAVSRRGLQMWAKEELEKVARDYAILTRYVQDEERSYKNALTAPYPSANIKPSDVQELERQVAKRERATSDIKRGLEELKRRESQSRKRYDEWWDLLRDLEYDGHVGRTSLTPFLPDGSRQFKNPAEFSAWLRAEDARRKKAEQPPESQTGPVQADPGPALGDLEPPPLISSK